MASFSRPPLVLLSASIDSPPGFFQPCSTAPSHQLIVRQRRQQRFEPNLISSRSGPPKNLFFSGLISDLDYLSLLLRWTISLSSSGLLVQPEPEGSITCSPSLGEGEGALFLPCLWLLCPLPLDHIQPSDLPPDSPPGSGSSFVRHEFDQWRRTSLSSLCRFHGSSAEGLLHSVSKHKPSITAKHRNKKALAAVILSLSLLLSSTHPLPSPRSLFL